VNPDVREAIMVYLDTGKEDLIELKYPSEAYELQEALELVRDGKGHTILIYGKTGEHLYPVERIIKIETIKE
jgi:hypothetical protein